MRKQPERTSDQERYLRAGMNECLTKPIDRTQLFPLWLGRTHMPASLLDVSTVQTSCRSSARSPSPPRLTVRSLFGAVPGPGPA